MHIHCFRGKALCTGCIRCSKSPNGRLEQEEYLLNVFLPLYFHKSWIKTLAARSSFVLVPGGRASVCFVSVQASQVLWSLVRVGAAVALGPQGMEDRKVLNRRKEKASGAKAEPTNG